MAQPRRARRQPIPPGKPQLLSQVAADTLATFLFVLGQAATVELSRALSPALGLSPGGTSLALVVALLLLMLPVCGVLGGALFNPANNALLYATGQGELVGHAARVVGQCVGAVLGVGAARALLPYPWQHGFANLAVGLRPDVDVFEGAAAEFVLGLLLAFLVSYSAELGSGWWNRFWKVWLPLVATVLAVSAGAPYSGPSLNPAVTLGWEFWYQQQKRGEHLFVFWVAPLAAGLMGGWSFLGMKEFTARRQKVKAD